jgi:hypothetical protein
MKNIFLILVIYIVTLCVTVAASYAAVINAASVSYSDINAAITGASNGDMVVVPSGTATWSSTLSINKNIVLAGAGVGNTVITSNIGSSYLIIYTPSTIVGSPSTTPSFRVTGFTFNCNERSGGINLRNMTTSKHYNVRIDHNKFTGSKDRNILINGLVFGVIDNNEVIAGSGIKIFDCYADNDKTWNALTSYTPGTADNIYYEDNSITDTDTPHSSGQGSRYVARYNTYTFNGATNPWFDMHGNQHNCPSTCTYENWGTMGAEIYGNIATYGARTGGWTTTMFDHRGGKAFIFNNKVTGNIQSTAQFHVREEFGDSDTPIYINTGKVQKVTDSYYWNNRQDSTLIKATESEDCCNAIAENSDFYNQNTSFNGTVGMGCGTLSNRPASCTTGVGYWATDQDCSSVDSASVGVNPSSPINGTLWKCTTTNVWTEYYTPYTYPHPLRTPATPKNVRIVNTSTTVP